MKSYGLFRVDVQADDEITSGETVVYKGHDEDFPANLIPISEDDLPTYTERQKKDELMGLLRPFAVHIPTKKTYVVAGVGFDELFGHGIGVVYLRRGVKYYRPWRGPKGFEERFQFKDTP